MIADSFKTGDIISERYELVQEIGRGGFGVVFRATQLGMDRDVAIKILHVNGGLDTNARERFRREALVIRNLNHPNTIRQYDFGETENGTLFLVLEFLQGLNLVQMIRRDGALGDERTRTFASGVLKSLSEAHSQGIVHRDLKPGNIMLCDVYGEKDYPKVLDFGIAKVMMGDSPDLTAVGIALGSPRYMAPEILRGEDPTPAADVYSVAISFAEAIIGQPLFKSEGSLDAAKIQLDTNPLPIPEILKVSSLWPWLSLGLKKDLAVRYTSAEEMLKFLDATIEELVARGADVISSIGPTNILPAVELGDHDSEPGRHTMIGTPTSEADDDTNVLTAADAQAVVDDLRRSEIEKNTTTEQAISEPILDAVNAAHVGEQVARETFDSPPPVLNPGQFAESRPTSVYVAVGSIPEEVSSPPPENATNTPVPVFKQQTHSAFSSESTDIHQGQGSQSTPKASIFEEPPPQIQSNMGPIALHEPEVAEEPEEKGQAKIVFVMVGLFVVGVILLFVFVVIFKSFASKETPKPKAEAVPKVEPEKIVKEVETKKVEKVVVPKVVKLLTFDLTSSPVGATVYVNGKRRGKTPLTFSMENSKLPIKILIKKKGYEPYKASLDGNSMKLEAALLPIFNKNRKKRTKKNEKRTTPSVPVFK